MNMRRLCVKKVLLSVAAFAMCASVYFICDLLAARETEREAKALAAVRRAHLIPLLGHRLVKEHDGLWCIKGFAVVAGKVIDGKRSDLPPGIIVIAGRLQERHNNALDDTGGAPPGRQ
jgi:hypothetical protein